MDIDLLRDKEQFSSQFDSNSDTDSYYIDDSTSLDGVHSFQFMYGWDMNHHREVDNKNHPPVLIGNDLYDNIDIANTSLIGNDLYENIDVSTTSPVHNCNNEQGLQLDIVKTEPGLQLVKRVSCSQEPPSVQCPVEESLLQQDDLPLHKNTVPDQFLDFTTTSTFDLTSYIGQEPILDVPKKTVKAAVKKLDIKAQRYIVDEDDNNSDNNVDIESVSEPENAPILEAVDLNSLLEQFEATEMPDLPTKFDDFTPTVFESSNIFASNDLNISDVISEPLGDIELKITAENLQLLDQKSEQLQFLNIDRPDADNISHSQNVSNKDHNNKIKVEKTTGCSILAQKLAETVEQNLSRIAQLREKQKTEQTKTKEKSSRKSADNTKKGSNLTESKTLVKNEANVPLVTTKATLKTKKEPPSSSESTTSPLLSESKNDKPQIKALPQKVVSHGQEANKLKLVPLLPPSPILEKAKTENRRSRMTEAKRIYNKKNIESGTEKSLPIINSSPNLTQGRNEDRTPFQLVNNKTNMDVPSIQTVPMLVKTADSAKICQSSSVTIPQGLLARMKESSQKKTIPVIPPVIPTSKKRPGSKISESNVLIKMIKLGNQDSIQLDHSYCSSPVNHQKCVKKEAESPLSVGHQAIVKKESESSSTEEDDPAIIRNQPTVKNADGKLMVSLLKVNTIRNPENEPKKKRLNLEEYKKRHQNLFSSLSNSPASSTCSSPTPIEDEKTRILKHQEKMQRMAKEILEYNPKLVKIEDKVEEAVVEPLPTPIVPEDMERKVLISIGVNTELVDAKDALKPVEQLEEIKPLLKKVSDKINSNSLITSMIENIPKVLNKASTSPKDSPKASGDQHGENKIIAYLPKNRTQVETRSVETQTNIMAMHYTKHRNYRRRRNSSTSSNSSRSGSRNSGYSKSKRKKTNSSSSRSRSRSSSPHSHSSRSSRYSARSRSRSRSVSPRNARQHERLREVEERRVIYVGRINGSTTKDDLLKRFQRFGPISNVSLHSRKHEYLDNYGFVTFVNRVDAYEAFEHGNDDPYYPKYDLSFGGRRIFCQTSYSDLDNVQDDESPHYPPRVAQNSFDALLKEAQEKLRKRKL